MPIGKVQKIVLCGGTDANGAVFTNTNPGQDYLAKRVLCPGNAYTTTFDAYVVDAANASRFEASFGEFDYAYAAGVWAVAFSMVVGLYAVSRGFGTVLGFIRRG